MSVADYIRVMRDPDYFPAPQVDAREVESNARKLKVAKIPITAERREMMLRYYATGIKGSAWYTQMYDEFLQMFWHQVDADMFIKFLAATSPNNGVESNVLYAFKAFAFFLARPNDPLPCFSKKAPAGTFKGFMAGHCGNLNRAIQNKPLSGPKVQAFLRAMFGDQNAVVVDRWVIRACGLKVPLTNTLTVTFSDGSKLKGKAWRAEGRRGYLFRSDLIRQGKRAGEDPIYSASGEAIFDVYPEIEEIGSREIYIPNRIIANAEWAEKALTVSEYRGLVRVVTEVSKLTQASPRDFQAALWTGIKIEQDPVGLENFVYYFRKNFGEDPYRFEIVEDMINRASFVKARRKESSVEEEAAPEDLPVSQAADETEATVIEAANMLH